MTLPMCSNFSHFFLTVLVVSYDLTNPNLPFSIGPKIMQEMDMSPAPRGKIYKNQYDPSVDPTVNNAFATAAFRFGHTMLPDLVSLIGDNNNTKLPFGPNDMNDFAFRFNSFA